MMRQRLAVLGLLLLAPVCAEYVSGYDSSTGNPSELLGNLVLFVPLYGGAAVLVRETARRLHLGWVGILLLAAAFGVLQAGLIDQSMFNDGYRGIDYWDELRTPTLIPAIGTSAFQILSFVGTHVINSIGLPVLAVEALVGRRDRTVRWLGRPGLVVTGVAFLSAAGIVLGWHLQTEVFRPSWGQVIGAAVAVVALVVAAVVLGRRAGVSGAEAAHREPVRLPWWAVVVAAFLAAAGYTAIPTTWLGVAIGVSVITVVFTAVHRLSRRPGWTDRHRAALLGALVPTALYGFWVDPIGNVAPAAQLAHNLVMTLGTTALVALAVWRSSAAARVPDAYPSSR